MLEVSNNIQQKAQYSEKEYIQLKNEISKLQDTNKSLKHKLEKMFEAVSMIKEGWNLVTQLVIKYNEENKSNTIDLEKTTTNNPTNNTSSKSIILNPQKTNLTTPKNPQSSTQIKTEILILYLFSI